MNNSRDPWEDGTVACGGGLTCDNVTPISSIENNTTVKQNKLYITKYTYMKLGNSESDKWIK